MNWMVCLHSLQLIFYISNLFLSLLLAVHSMLDFPTISGSSGFDPRRQPPDQDNKGGRPPPGIDI